MTKKTTNMQLCIPVFTPVCFLLQVSVTWYTVPAAGFVACHIYCQSERYEWICTKHTHTQLNSTFTLNSLLITKIFGENFNDCKFIGIYFKK